MTELLFRVKVINRPDLSDDRIVEDCMGMLTERYPQVQGYQWERLEEGVLQILMWGDLGDAPTPTSKEGHP
jgi:hypothetical protein